MKRQMEEMTEKGISPNIIPLHHRLININQGILYFFFRSAQTIFSNTCRVGIKLLITEGAIIQVTIATVPPLPRAETLTQAPGVILQTLLLTTFSAFIQVPLLISV